MTIDVKERLEDLERLALTVRMLAADGVEKANSGHPGMPMGAADYATVMWAKYLRFDPQRPDWTGRDRFVLSAGHGSMLLYSLLHLFGYELPLSELQSFRQWDSKTPGHPEFGLTPGVETTTGPLGAGFANGVGIALSAKLMQARYGSDLFGYRVYGIVSDGDLMEGVASEAASLAGHLGLDNLIYVYDDNEISIGGSTDVCFTEDVPKRFEAYGWNVLDVNGHDMLAIDGALQKALARNGRPTLIVAHTTIGFGSPHKAGSAKVHGEPLGKDELKATKESLGWPLESPFLIPDEVKSLCASIVERKSAARKEWDADLEAWSAKNAALAAELRSQLSREVPASLKSDLIEAFEDAKKEATRGLSGKAIQVIAKKVPYLVGGSADLEPSTKTLINDSQDIQKGQFAGRNIRFGVREHAMGSLVNGLAYGRCWFPYSATFLVFSDYMRPSIRLAALSHLQSLFIFTHESFWVGEDGPTHQPIEHIASLRAIPNLYVFRPADGLETGMSYFAALELKKSPSALLFTRQNLPPLERPAGSTPDDILRGGYVLRDPAGADGVIIATGSEVWVAVEAAKLLESSGVKLRVVSMPCVELFMKQDESYRSSVLPPGLRRISLEAGITMPWYSILGPGGIALGIDHFGASAPGEVLAEKFGFTPETVKARILQALAR